MCSIEHIKDPGDESYDCLKNYYAAGIYNDKFAHSIDPCTF